MPFNVTVKDPAARRAEISAHCSASMNTRRCHEMSTPRDLKVIRLDIHVPIYRMDNYRTQSRQLARIAELDLEVDFFQAGQENELAQQAQHEILSGLAFSGSGETIIAISDALAQKRSQTEPLLITSDGVVVNGNRRLSAMRELFGTNPTDFASFAQIEAMVLPADIDDAEIRRIEVRLQMTPQTLLPYDWTDHAMAVRDLQQRGFRTEEIAALMQLSEQGVAALLTRLDEADLYLSECLGQPANYVRVETAEQHFKEMEKALRGKLGTTRTLSRRIGQAVLRGAPSFQTRIYDYRVIFGQDIHRAIPMLAERLGLQPREQDQPDPDDLFGGAPDDLDRWADLGAVLLDASRTVEVTEAIKEVAEDIIESNRGLTVLEMLRKAAAQVSGVNPANAGTETFDAILAQITAIETSCARLRTNIADRQAAVAENN